MIRARWVLVAWLAASPAVSAAVIQAPVGGRPVPVGPGRMVCGQVGGGWALEPDRRSVRPPPEDAGPSGPVEIKVAGASERCGPSAQKVTLQSVGPFPEVDPGSVLFFPDEGRLELKGRGLVGVQVLWEAGERSGQDRCLETGSDKVQTCVVPVERNLPMTATLRWLPAGARVGPDVVTYDASGHKVDPAGILIRPTRVIINRVLASDGPVDISQGAARIPLAHPRAAASVDCGLARCEIADDAVLVRGVPGPATQLTVHVRLSPRVFLQRGERLETAVSALLPLVHCPLAVVSGLPLRDADQSRIVMRMDQRCGQGGQLRWTVGAEPAEVARVLRAGDNAFVLLEAGRLTGDKVTITAMRSDSGGGLVGSLTVKTAPAPRPQVAVELPGRGRIDFIPTNRDAVLSVGGAGDRAKLIPLSVEGVYTVRSDKGRYVVRGDANVGGFVSLRFGYRIEGLPPELAGTNLAVLIERVQRTVREASVPAAFWTADESSEPLAEFLCAGPDGNTQRLVPGRPTRIAFEARETCRVLIHQERLRPEDGLQEVVLDIDVDKADGGRRADASMNERMVLRPGGESRAFWLKGVTEQFDRVTVRLSHVVDETRYVLSPTARQAPPSVQWSATVEGGLVRLYVTLAIPAGLYRMNDPAGQLTLNFGVLGRVALLDRYGRERLLGIETGVMGIGLSPQRQGGVRDFPRTLAAVAGWGFRIGLGAGAAVGLHLWGAYEFRRDYEFEPEGAAVDPVTQMRETRKAPRWAIIFGPSISIGNVGTNL